MSIYEEVEIEDMDYDEAEMMYFYPCPCGDRFRIALEDLHEGDDIASCPSCTLQIRIIFDQDDLPPLPPEEEDDEGDIKEEDSDE